MPNPILPLWYIIKKEWISDHQSLSLQYIQHGLLLPTGFLFCTIEGDADNETTGYNRNKRRDNCRSGLEREPTFVHVICKRTTLTGSHHYAGPPWCDGKTFSNIQWDTVRSLIDMPNIKCTLLSKSGSNERISINLKSNFPIKGEELP